MAIVKIGAPLAGIRGTLGGITYSENGASVYAKQWSKPSNPRTPKQTRERSYLSSIPALWAALTDVQRAAWRTFAADPAQELTNSLGETYYASGYNWFTKCNVRLLRLSLSTISAVPTQARPAAPVVTEFRVCETGTESNLCTGGTASASSFTVGYPPAEAFDGILTGSNTWITAAGQTTGWLEYDLSVAANVKHYRIWAGTTPSGRHPKDWTFEVYTSGAWQVIHTVTNCVFIASEWMDFYIVNPYAETKYRMNISANNGDGTYLQINELEFYAGDVGASVIIYPEDEFDASPDYDLVSHVAQGLSPALLEQYPGYYEVAVNSAPNRWAQPIQDALEDIFGVIQMSRSWHLDFYRQTIEGLRSARQTARTITIGA